MTDIVIMINQILFFYGIGASLLAMLGMEDVGMGFAFFLILLQMWLVLMRRAAGRILILLAGHLFAAVISLGSIQIGWLGAASSKPFFMAAAILMIVFSLLVRLFPGWSLLEKPGIYQLILLALFWALDVYAKKVDAQGIVYWCFAGVMICMLVHRNLTEAETYIRNHAPSTKLDLGRLRAMNRLTSLAYGALLGICFLVASMCQPDGVGRKILEAIRSFLKWLLSFAPDGMENRATEWEKEQGIDHMTGGDMLQTAPDSELGKIIDKIIYYGGILLAVALLLFMVISIFVLAYRFFYQKKKPADDIEEYTEPIRTKAVRRKKKPGGERSPWRSPAKRIRRLYKRSMRHFWGRSSYAPEYLTPKEQLRFLREHEAELKGKKAWFYAMTPEEQEEFLHLYEKARYSGAQVTEEDAARMEQLLQKM